MFETVNNVRYNNGTSKHIFLKVRYGNHVSRDDWPLLISCRLFTCPLLLSCKIVIHVPCKSDGLDGVLDLR